MSRVGNEPVPEEYIRLKVCEKMHWTFEEYDNTSAEDIAVALELWRIEDQTER